MADQAEPTLTAALEAADRGWHVFPLRPGDKRPAFPDHSESRCVGRDSRCRHGHQGWEPRATSDYDRIRRAWSAAPYNVGVACGPSELIVIDLDVPKGPDDKPGRDLAHEGVATGEDMFALLCAQAGETYPVRTFTVLTGSGGRHLYFTAPEQRLGNTSGRLGWKIDTRGAGGYVVGAGSVVVGKPYVVADDSDPDPLPDWLIRLLLPVVPHVRPVAGLPVPTSADRRVAYLRAAVAQETDRILSASPGTRNNALYIASVALGQLVAGGALNEHEITAWLSACALQVGQKPDEVHRTISSGLQAGSRRPRGVAV